MKTFLFHVIGFSFLSLAWCWLFLRWPRAGRWCWRQRFGDTYHHRCAVCRLVLSEKNTMTGFFQDYTCPAGHYELHFVANEGA